MEFNKRTILWIVFAVSLFVLWNDWMVANGKQSLLSNAPPAKVATAPAAQGNSVQPNTATTAAVPGAPAAAPIATRIVTVTTDLFKVDINTAGGVIQRLELLKYRDKVDQSKNQLLFHVDSANGRTYLGQTGLTGNSPAGPMPSHSTPFTVRSGPTVDANGQVQLVLEAEQGGVRLTKTFTFKRGDYVIGVRHDVANVGAAAVNPVLYLQLMHDGSKPEGDTFFNSSYTGPTLYTSQDKYQKLTFDKIAKGSAEHSKTATDGWIAISQHFFVSAFVPPEKLQRDIETKSLGNNLFAIRTNLPLGTLQPGQTVSNESRLYSGPQEEKLLEAVTPGLDLVRDYAWAAIIAKPIFATMNWLHSMIGNWGWTIIAFTILIKLLFFPLSAAGYRSMAKMKTVTPKMQAIRERFKDDPVKMQQATMELYKSEKINPLGGCLPILVQMPVFLALYWVLQAAVEMRGASWGWVPDLTMKDPLFILPILYAISMFVTQKLNPQPADPMQAKMMMFMPIAFSVIFLFFPAGLVLYWVANNLISMAQQYVITKKYAPAK
ncbi:MULTISPECIES: membrane protein insertase YidC [Oxalobacteraceae]|uniref:membrane protein insertase YidC n=1 Tax=Oxalobacteraceae TaxID=75682 RepID=UPI001150BA41|nr:MULTISPECIES: membrane protein insertase YidC [Oxalobacteraceae]TQK05652.1 protein translocase subunit yidC [Herbaspirillum sp. SJZ107]